jgi:hypothetical protein
MFPATSLPQEEFRIADFELPFIVASLLLALCVVLAGTLGFELRISILETDGFAS